MGVNLTRWRKLSLELHAAGLGTPQSHVSGAYAETLDRHIAAEAPHSEEELPDKVCAHRQLQSVLATALRTLPVRYQRVVALYYSQGATMRQIGNELGVNESRVSQIHKAALEKLNLALRSRGIGGADMFVGQ